MKDTESDKNKNNKNHIDTVEAGDKEQETDTKTDTDTDTAVDTKHDVEADLLRIRKPRSNNVGVKQHIIPPAVQVRDGVLGTFPTVYDVILSYYQNDTTRSVCGIGVICIFVFILLKYNTFRTGKSIAASTSISTSKIRNEDSNSNNNSNNSSNSSNNSYKYIRNGLKLMNKRNKMKSSDVEVEVDSRMGLGMGTNSIADCDQSDIHGLITHEEDCHTSLGLKTI